MRIIKENNIEEIIKSINSELPPLTEVDGFLVNIANATSLPKLTRSFQPRIVPKLYC